MTITVRRATVEDEPGMAGALGRAFADDPLFDWLVPDQTKRHGMLPAWFTLAFKKMFTRREVYTTDDHAGAAVWVPPANGRPSRSRCSRWSRAASVSSGWGRSDG